MSPRSGLSPTTSSLVNLALYQLGWFACVLGAAWGRGVEGAAVALGLVGIHLLLAEAPGREWPLLAAAAALGLAVETVHLRLGVLRFDGPAAGAQVPLWIFALWVQFATVLHFCLRWLSGRYGLSFVLGLVGGPLAFLAGERLGAASLGEPRGRSIAILAVAWSLALPLLVAVADRLGPSSGRYRLPRRGR